jgi:hypothetical protein
VHTAEQPKPVHSSIVQLELSLQSIEEPQTLPQEPPQHNPAGQEFPLTTLPDELQSGSIPKHEASAQTPSHGPQAGPQEPMLNALDAES